MRWSRRNNLPIKITFHDAVSALDEPEEDEGAVARRGRAGARRGDLGARFDALHAAIFRGDRSGSALGRGGNGLHHGRRRHTGGEMVVNDTLRSLMGMGASVFTLGQQYMVFTTDERINGPAAASSP